MIGVLVERIDKITLDRLAVENAFELGFDVFSASRALHEGRIDSEIHFYTMLIQNLSKMDFQDKNIADSLLNLLVINFLRTDNMRLRETARGRSRTGRFAAGKMRSTR